MALAFSGSTDKVTITGSTTLGVYAAYTICSWIYTTSDTARQAIFRCAINIDLSLSFEGATAGDPFYVHREGSTYCEAKAPAANFSAYGLNKWLYAASVVKDGGVNTDQKLFIGDLSNNAAEPSSYTSQVAGSGGGTSSNVSYTIGNFSDSRPFVGRIAMVAVYSGAKTEQEIVAQQWAAYPLHSGCLYFCQFGWNGTGTQPDWSGNQDNGTVTGATVADHVPLGFFSPPKANDFGPDSNIALDSGSDNPANWLQGVKISY